MNKINVLIDETAPIADEHKLFLKTILGARKELIIDFSYNKLRKMEKSTKVLNASRYDTAITNNSLLFEGTTTAADTQTQFD